MTSDANVLVARPVKGLTLHSVKQSVEVYSEHIIAHDTLREHFVI